MLQSTKKFQEVISLYIQSNQMRMIFQDDWDMYNVIYNFLKVFYTPTNDCSGVYYLTTQLVITHIYCITNNFKAIREKLIFKYACAVMELKIKLSSIESFITAIN